MCVHDQTSPPDDHSAWKKKNSISFWSREREGETATQSKLIALCSVIDEQLVIWYTWTVDSLILKKKTLNNTWIMHLSSGNLKLLGYAYKNSTDSGCM